MKQDTAKVITPNIKEASFYDTLITGQSDKFVPLKTKKIEVCNVTVTPNKARYILQKYNNTAKLSNRKPSKMLVAKYAQDMINGDWKPSGQTIQFSSDGDFMDGQHRLLAIIQSDIPQDCLVVYGLNRDSFDIIDSGKSRSFGDIAQIKGYTDPALLASLARAIIAYESTGDVDSGNSKFKSGGTYQITKTQVMNYLEDHPEIQFYLDRYRKCPVASSTTSAFCYWMLSSNGDQEKAETYLDSVFHGYNLQPNTIEEYLHNKLVRNAKANQNKMTKKAIMANIIEGYRRVAGISKNKSMQITWDSRNGLPTLK